MASSRDRRKGGPRTPSPTSMKRLLKDLDELSRHPVVGVYAAPLEDNAMEWHANLCGLEDTPFEGVVLHAILHFPPTYPSMPPTVEMATDYPHPNILRGEAPHHRLTVCLDMLLPAQADSLPYRCWSSAFSTCSVLTQVRSFLLQEGQSVLTNFRVSLQGALDASRAFTCQGCGHTAGEPWPPLRHPPSPQPRLISASDVIRTVRVPTTTTKPRQSPSATPGELPQPSPSSPSSSPSTFGSSSTTGHSIPAAEHGTSVGGGKEDEGWVTVKAKKKTDGGPNSSSIPIAGTNGKHQNGGGGGPSNGGVLTSHTTSATTAGSTSSSGSRGVTCGTCKSTLPPSAFSATQLKKPAGVKRCSGCLAAARGSSSHSNHSSISSNHHHASQQSHPHGVVGRGGASSSPPSSSSWTVGAPAAALSPQQQQPPVASPTKHHHHHQQPRHGMNGHARHHHGSSPAGKGTSSPEAAAAASASAVVSLRKDGWLQVGEEGGGPFRRLDLNVSLRVMEFLNYSDVGKLAQTCKLLAAESDDGLVWRELFSRQYPRSQLAASTMADWKRCFLLEFNHLSEDLRCWYTKHTPEEDILGVPLEYTVNPVKRSVDHIMLWMEVLSLTAYRDHGVRRTCWGEKFQLFLPLYINPSHFNRALPYIQHCLVKLFAPPEARPSSSSSSPPPPFHPSMALDSLPKLMNTMAVLLSDQGLTPSESALEGFCQVHRLLLALRQRYRTVMDRLVDEKLTSFIRRPEARNKKSFPSLGNLLPLVAISPRYKWHDIAIPYLQESFTRNVLWSCKESPELADLDLPPRERLDKTLQKGLISRRTTLFNSFFLRMVARPPDLTLEQVASRYDMYLGRPSLATRRMLQRAVRDILSAETWPDFFRLVGVSTPSEAQLFGILRDAVQSSLDNGYHKPKQSFHKVGRRGFSRVLLRGGDKYATPPNLKGVVMRCEWRYPDGVAMQYLDASCLVYDAHGRQLALCDYCHVSALDGKLRHSSDVMEVAAHRGQHLLTLDLGGLPRAVHSLFIVLSTWKAGLTAILQPSVTLQDRDNGQAELCRFEVEDSRGGGGSSTGTATGGGTPQQQQSSILMCRLYREGKGRGEWKVKALGQRGQGCADRYEPIEEMIGEVFRPPSPSTSSCSSSTSSTTS